MEKLFEQPNIVQPEPGGRYAPKMNEANKAGKMSVGETFIRPRIIGGIFEGATFRTAASGARIEIFPKDDTTLGIASYDAVGAPVFTTKIYGDDIGDVIMGSIDAGKYVQWDASEANLVINGVTLQDFVAVGIQTGSSLALQKWTSSLIFTASDYNTVAWTTGDIRMTGGAVYSINSGNTGNMTVLTYIYFDSDVSSTVLQLSTDPADTVGANKIQVGVATPNTSVTRKAKFQIYSGAGGINVSVDEIAANDASTNEFVTATAEISDGIITYAKIQNVANARLLGNSSGGAGAPMEITIGTGLTLAGGELSNSLDLSGYVPYTGATGDVDLGTNDLTVRTIFRYQMFTYFV
jgi:hypothetical protein